MKLYIVTSEKGTRYVFSDTANNARSLAGKDKLGGHKITRRVWRDKNGEIVDFGYVPCVVTETEAMLVLRKAGYNLDGSKYHAPVVPEKKPVNNDRRVCRICGLEKSLAEFPPRSGGGYQSYCRPCKIEYDRESRLRKKREKEKTTV